MNVWRIKDSFLWVYRSFDSGNYTRRSRYFDRTIVARNTNLNGHFILSGRGGRARTADHRVPTAVRYQLRYTPLWVLQVAGFTLAVNSTLSL